MNKRTRNYILIAIALVGVWYFFLKEEDSDQDDDGHNDEIVDRTHSTRVDNSTITSRLQTPIIR